MKTKDELAASLEEIARIISDGLNPILQFDCHGSKELGLEIGSSDEFISWVDLAELFRLLNFATDNNLVVLMSACHAFDAIVEVRIAELTPFYALIAPETEITEGTLEVTVPNFYRTLLETKNFELAFEHLAAEFRLFNCEAMFIRALVAYMRDNCFGKGGVSRKERLLSQGLEGSGLHNTRENRRMMRRIIKNKLRPSREMVEKFSQRFLFPRKLCISYEQVLELARKAQV